MMRTASIRLALSAAQARALAALRTAYADACNRLVPMVREHRLYNRVGLHQRTYTMLREATPLGSQMCCNAIFSVCKAYKAQKELGRIRKDAPIPDIRFNRASVHFDKRTYTLKGKTVSLYTCLNLLNKPGVNIATAEDPSEINLPGVNQVNVNEKAGLTFAVALKSFLRQDPDIIMVGEIRDLETADISIKAAQTGHLVLSTLHTNDAPTTLTRMRNMGIAPFNIASSVILITAQRLARRLRRQRSQSSQPSKRSTAIQSRYEQQTLTATSNGCASTPKTEKARQYPQFIGTTLT